jgi:hypothetical protein
VPAPIGRLDLWKNLFGWISYTLSRSDRMDHPDQDWRIFELDQTHILTILASYKLPRGIQVGVRFRYVTGNPYTLHSDIQNVYYAKNPEGVTYSFNYKQKQTINGLPILPVYGIRGEF